jgi:hypothetical protein
MIVNHIQKVMSPDYHIYELTLLDSGAVYDSPRSQEEDLAASKARDLQHGEGHLGSGHEADQI